MNRDYHYPALSSGARAANRELFQFEGFCDTTRSAEVTDYLKSARLEKARPATNNGGPDWDNTSAKTWLVQETIAQQPGTSNGSTQGAYALFKGLVKELKGCKNEPGVVLTLSEENPVEAAATIEFNDKIPGTSKAVLNEYLAVEDGSVVELSLWKTTDPDGNTNKVEWPAPGPADKTVLNGMVTPIREHG